jgi:hypothetical protein
VTRLLALVMVLVIPQPGGGPAAELARKIVEAVGPLEELALQTRGLEGVAAAEIEDAERDLRRELARRGARVVEGGGSARVTLTLSGTAGLEVWVAEVARGASRTVALASRPRTAVPPRAEAAGPIALEKRLLVEEQEPILDVALLDRGLLVLDTGGVSLVPREGDAPRRLAQLPASWVPPRDPRGRLAVAGGSFRAYLPGLTCAGEVDSLGVRCQEGESSWPLDIGSVPLAPGRNHFAPGGGPTFFSVAAAGGGAWVAAGLDGRALLLDVDLQVTGAWSGWGSDLAAIETGCGGGRYVLATRPATAAGESDALQAFEVVRRQAVGAGAPLEFPGPVTALWTDGARNGAVAVVRNPKSGSYAALHVSVRCDR